MLADGILAEDAYYRALARHLRLPFFTGEVGFDASLDPAKAMASGIAPLRPNPFGVRSVVAPRGASIRFLTAAAAEGRSLAGLAVASPRRFNELIRLRAGATVAAAAAGDLGRRDPSLSAYAAPSRAAAAAVVGVAFALGPAAPGWLETAVSTCLWVTFAAWIVTRNLAVAAAAGSGGPGEFQADEALPVYSIVAPLYREANMVARLARALEALDYPRAKLDIKLVVEADDAATLAAVRALELPPPYEIIIAPPGQPRTKPRALNIALAAVRGEFVVVYDAEDIPDPDQLRLAAARFAADPGLDCLQARLTVENSGEAWLAHMFALEYAALFDLINPGLAALGLPIALGGTSNHFRARTLRKVGGCDAWNVTEDADLGIRLARCGALVGALHSDTKEEAPVRFSVWYWQRVRWQKGWMQTLIVHSRRPARIVRELGVARAAAAMAMIGG
ncbi:MAG: glycosyltransferase, partial [Hyphomicrobiales bacterium]|nr:glycosyltransferase [Hyphomicrobiales bacterium]